MILIFRIVGIIFILIGAINAFSSWGLYPFPLFLIIGGVLIIAFSEVLKSLRNIEGELSNLLMQNAPESLQNYYIHSEEFVIYRGDHEKYEFFEWENEQYVRVRIFKHYLDLSGESYTIALPGKEQIKMEMRSPNHPDGEIWIRKGQPYVRLGALDLIARLLPDGKITVESLSKLS